MKIQEIKALERIHSSGTNTCAFIGPLFPGKPEKLVADLDGLVDRVLIDRMNYLNQTKAFYRQLTQKWATEDEFFQEYKARLILELKKRRIKFEAVF